jgi:hypothetical protein
MIITLVVDLAEDTEVDEREGVGAFALLTSFPSIFGIAKYIAIETSYNIVICWCLWTVLSQEPAIKFILGYEIQILIKNE